MALPRTHYDTLGIECDADDAGVRRAWKVLIQVWHPDRFTGEMREQAEAQTARINEAYHVLRDSSRRSAYDRRLDADAASSSADKAPRAPFSQGFTGRTTQRSTTPRPATATAATTLPAPTSAGDAISEFAAAAVTAARRYPRATAAVVALWILVVLAGPVRDHLTRATLPAPSRLEHAVDAASSTASELPALEDSSTSDAGAPVPEPSVSGGGAGTTTDAPPAAYPDAYAAEPIPQPEPQPRHIIRVMPKVTTRR